MEPVAPPSSVPVQRKGGRWPFTRRTKSFDSHDLIMAARKQARLEDMGTSAFRSRLDAMIDAWRQQSRTPAHDAVVRRWLTDLIVRRAELIDLAKKNPELVDAALAAPVVVTGLPGASLRDGVNAVRCHGAMASADGLPDDLDRTTWGFDVSVWGLAFTRFLGVDLAGLEPHEADELYWFHHLQAASNGLRPWIVAGSDHIFGLDALMRSYPNAAVVEVPIEVSDAIESSIGIERDCAEQAGRDMDIERARLRWTTIVERAEQCLDAARDGPIPVVTLDAFVAEQGER